MSGGGRVQGRRRATVAGLFISFEGADGCGKTTQAALLSETLRRRGLDVVATREPGGTPLGEKLRALLLDTGPGGPVDEAEMLLMAAARAQHVREVVLPALERGAVVVTDRFIDSSIAYQAGGLGLPEEDVRQVNLIATGGLWPRKTIWLDVEPRVGLERAGAAAAPAAGAVAAAAPAQDESMPRLDRIEERGLDFQRRVVQTYRRLAAEDPKRWIRIEVTELTVEEVAAAVEAVVNPLLKEAGFAR